MENNPTTHGNDHAFQAGERAFNYYDGEWGTVQTNADAYGWFEWRSDSGKTTQLNDERAVLEAVAVRHGYPADPMPFPADAVDPR